MEEPREKKTDKTRKKITGTSRFFLVLFELRIERVIISWFHYRNKLVQGYDDAYHTLLITRIKASHTFKL